MYCVLFSGVSSSARYSRRYSGKSSKKLLEYLADMPKVNTPRISEAQRQRQQIAKKSEKYGPSSVYLQVLGSGARGTPNTLYLFTDQKRYLFNCGEQTQRLAHEHKVKLSRLNHIFITSKTWRNIGGLPGLSLTLQDVGVPTLTLHGPDGLDELYNATRRFVIMKDMNVSMAKCGPSQDYEDNVMTVKYVVLKPMNIELTKELKDLTPAAKKPKMAHETESAYEQFIHDDTDYYKPTKLPEQTTTHTYVKERAKTAPSKLPVPLSPDRQKDRKCFKNLKVLELLEDMKTNTAVCYICILKKRLGTLDLAKCVELGVKPGPLLGQLKSGHDVVLPDGTLVLSKDVKTPDDPGPVFIVLEVPDITYLNETEFSAHFADGTNPDENIPTVVVHYTPPEVFHHTQYQDFIAKFGPSTRHLILNGQNSCLGSEAVHRTQHKLHLLDPDIFPLLKDVSIPTEWSAPTIPKGGTVRIKGMEELKNKIAIAQFQNILNMESTGRDKRDSNSEDLQCTAGRTLTVVHLRPRKQLDRSAEPKLHIQEYIHETMDVDGFVSSLEQFRRIVDGMRYAKAVDVNEYPKVVFLGTGSCIPSKTRNTSGIVVHVDENRSILLDCGEGTFGQLVRFYGPKRVNSFLRTLRAIYISHLHADHHIGLIGVLQARRQAFDEVNAEVPPDPVYLLAPGQIITWLMIYDQHFEQIRGDYSLIPNQNLVMDAETKPFTGGTELTAGVLSQIGVKEIRTCYVPHCPNAFGVCVDIGPHRITYSGDTLPCEALVKLGANSSLLIHEATMEDELALEARTKMHSTTTQAIEIGKQMNAKYTVLTHFSQRYARLPRLNANILNHNTSVGIAFDNMQITMSDLDLLPHMYAPLQLMFAEHCVEMELKAAHRARQKLRAQGAISTNELTAPVTVPEISIVPTDPSVLTSAETMSSYQPPYRESNASRLRAEAWNMDGGVGEPLLRPRRRRRKISLVLPDNPPTPNKPADKPPQPPTTNADSISVPKSVSPTKKRLHTAPNSFNGSPRSLSSSPTIFNAVRKNSNATPNSFGVALKTPIAGQKSLNVTAKSLNTTAKSLNTTPNSLNASPKSVRATQKSLSATSKCLSTTPKTLNATPKTLNAPRTPESGNRSPSVQRSARSAPHVQPSLNSKPPPVDNGHGSSTKTVHDLGTANQNAVSEHATPYELASSFKNKMNDISALLGNAYGKPLVTNLSKKLTINKSFPRRSFVPPEPKHPLSDKIPKNRIQKPMFPQKAVNKIIYEVKPTSDVQRDVSNLSSVNDRGLKDILSVSSENNLGNAKVRNKRVSPTQFAIPRSQEPVMNRSGSPDKDRPVVKGFDQAVARLKLKDNTNVKLVESSGSSASTVSNPNHGDIRSLDGAAVVQIKKESMNLKPAGSFGSFITSGASKQNYDRKSFVSTSTILENNGDTHVLEIKEEICKMKCMSTRRSKPIPAYRISKKKERNSTLLQRPAKEALMDERVNVGRGEAHIRIHNRGFKPELEDIKSSFLLLNTRTQRLREIARKQTTPICWTKPKPINEEERRKQIIEVKNKFQGKEFLQAQSMLGEMEYDKIEGLNWISWN